MIKRMDALPTHPIYSYIDSFLRTGRATTEAGEKDIIWIESADSPLPTESGALAAASLPTWMLGGSRSNALICDDAEGPVNKELPRSRTPYATIYASFLESIIESDKDTPAYAEFGWGINPSGTAATDAKSPTFAESPDMTPVEVTYAYEGNADLSAAMASHVRDLGWTRIEGKCGLVDLNGADFAFTDGIKADAEPDQIVLGVTCALPVSSLKARPIKGKYKETFLLGGRRLLMWTTPIRGLVTRQPDGYHRFLKNIMPGMWMGEPGIQSRGVATNVGDRVGEKLAKAFSNLLSSYYPRDAVRTDGAVVGAMGLVGSYDSIDIATRASNFLYQSDWEPYGFFRSIKLTMSRELAVTKLKEQWINLAGPEADGTAPLTFVLERTGGADFYQRTVTIASRSTRYILVGALGHVDAVEPVRGEVVLNGFDELPFDMGSLDKLMSMGPAPRKDMASLAVGKPELEGIK